MLKEHILADDVHFFPLDKVASMKTQSFRIATLGMLLLLMVSASFAVTVSRTVMFYKPTDYFGEGLTALKLREANATMTKPVGGGDWWSVTLDADSSQYNNTFEQGNYSVFFQPTTSGFDNQCYDLDGWNKKSQNCTNKFPNMGKIGAAGSWQNDTMWVVPDQFDAALKPIIFFSEPVFWTFYFVPPDDEDWFQGRAQMIVNGGTPVYMNTDPDYCGVYRQVYFKGLTGREPPTSVIFTLDIDNSWQVGYNGIAEDVGTPINLKDEFEKRGDGNINLIFDADGGAEGWTTDMFTGAPRQCGYNLAAIIYDTDASLHGAFTCSPNWYQGVDEKKNACPYSSAPYKFPSISPTPCLGVTTGIVDPILGSDKKPVYNSSSNCFVSQEAFDVMFRSTPKVNQTFCYDLPFTRSSDGKWEFDSDNYTSPGATVKGGFYPAETSPTNMLSDPLTTAENKRRAEGPVFLCEGFRANNAAEGVPEIDVFCNGPGWKGGNDCSGLFTGGSELDKAGLLPAGTTGDGWGWSCPNEAPTGWTKYVKGTETVSKANDAENRWTSGASESDAMTSLGRNQHFCFESHAEFVYRPGQRFSFRGDDDIWIYIGGKLAVDLGGTHLAAPGYVVLDDITDKNGNKLSAGQKYPIDIFFCDRRTTMSNVRIKTNIFFDQKSGLYAEQVSGDTTTSQVCMMSGSSNSCAALVSGTGASTVECGDLIANKLQFFMTNRLGDTLWIDASLNTACKETGANTTCYGGITLNSGKITLDKSKLNGLAGTYIIWARIKPELNTGNLPAARIKKFTTSTSVAVIAGKADIDGKKIDLSLPSGGVVAGKRVPVYFASGSLDNVSGEFVVNTEDVEGTTFTLNQTTGFLEGAAVNAELEIYTSETATSPVPASQQFSISASGLCTLWVAGNYKASDTYTYTLNVSGAKTPAAQLEVRLPSLRFVAEDGSAIDPWGTGLRDAGTNKILPIMMGTEIKMWLEAYDPADPTSVCTSCNFSLAGKGEVPDTSIAKPIDFFGLKQSVKEGVLTGGIIAGKAAISIAGAEPVKDPYWAYAQISGLSAKTVARWDSLRFKEPPVPYPEYAAMFDKNGDGIGDSLFIRFNRAVPADSIPDTLQIWWPESSTDSIQLYRADIAPYFTNGGLDLILANREYSDDIMTDGQGRVRSWSTYKDPDQGNVEVTTGFPKVISDRMGPVIAQATYSGKNSGCGDNAAKACYDNIVLEFSEPVVLDSMATTYGDTTSLDLYEFKRLDNLLAGWTLIPPQAQSRRDTVAGLTYVRYVGSNTPLALDSVRLRGDSISLRLLRDVEGNFPHPANARKIEGVKPLSIYVVLRGNIDSSKPPKDSAISIIIIPPGMPLDSVSTKYPGTVGHVVLVDVPGKIFTLSQNTDLKVTAADIKLYVEAYYYSNLGGYGASAKYEIRCDDAGLFGTNCLDNPGYIYTAWNGITDDKRFVGSGAYISDFKFHWTLKLPSTKMTLDKAGSKNIHGFSRLKDGTKKY